MKTPFLIAAAAIGIAFSVQAGPAFLGVASGDVSSSDAVLWTRVVDEAAPAELPVTVTVSTDPSLAVNPLSSQGQTSAGRDFTVKLVAAGLQPGKVYYYQFSSGSSMSVVGRFKTAPEAKTAAAVTFGFSGDADGLMRPYPLAKEFPKLGLDFFAFVGDVIYETGSQGSSSVAASGTVPVPSEKGATQAQLFVDYSRKYREQWVPLRDGGQAGLAELFSSQGNYTLYDNHELGNRQYINGGAPAGGPVGDAATGAGVDARDPANDVNRTGMAMHQAAGFRVLQQVYANEEPIREVWQGGSLQLYSSQRWGKNVLFVNLDTRTFRDIRMKTKDNADEGGPRADNPDRTYIGKGQLAWLKLTLLQAQHSGVRWKFVTTSDPIDQVGPLGGGLTGVSNGGNEKYSIVGSDGGKSWIGGYRAERNELLKFVADNTISNVVFLTTDDHQNRINEILYSPSGQTGVQSSYVPVPSCFEIVAGPLGATGPDGITDHSFESLKKIADSLAAAEKQAGVDPIGLDPKYPGLHHVFREGDPLADKLRQPIDFYSPDTFNLAVLSVTADGKTLTVKTVGRPSTTVNSFLEADALLPARTILSFQVDAR